jgi:hypothetical protein
MVKPASVGVAPTKDALSGKTTDARFHQDNDKTI